MTDVAKNGGPTGEALIFVISRMPVDKNAKVA